MKKTQIREFIDKYYLAGECESVLVETSDGDIKCQFINDSKTVLGSVLHKGIDMPDGILGIYQTNALMKMIGALDEDIKIKYRTSGDITRELEMSDAYLNAKFILSPPDIIPEVATLKVIPEDDLIFEFNSDDAKLFSRANNALADAASFAIISTESEIKFVLNYAELPTHRIEIPILSVKQSKVINPIFFSTKMFQNIINANKHASLCTIKISAKGLATMQFSADDFESTYYVRSTIS